MRLEGEQVERHCRPAGIAAKAAPKDERPENLRHGVVDGSGLENAEEEVIPESLDLHVLPPEHAQIDQQVQPDKPLHGVARPLLPLRIQRHARGQPSADIEEIKEIKGVF